LKKKLPISDRNCSEEVARGMPFTKGSTKRGQAEVDQGKKGVLFSCG